MNFFGVCMGKFNFNNPLTDISDWEVFHISHEGEYSAQVLVAMGRTTWFAVIPA